MADIFSFDEVPIDSIIPNKTPVEQLKLSTCVFVLMVHGTPLFFMKDSYILPTLFCLHQYPSLLPPVYIPQEASSFLLNGADLMCPGVLSSPQFFEGQGCSVFVAGNPLPFAVGVMAVSGVVDRSMKGKAVQIFHIFGDHLSDLSGNKTSDPEGFFADRIVGIGKEEVEKELLSTEEEPNEETTDEENEEGSSGTGGNQEISPGEMDNLLLSTCALKLKMTKDEDLPLLVSTFFHSCVVDTNLDVKKSSFKKVSVLMKRNEEDGVINTEETSPGVLRITAIDRSHERLKAVHVEQNQENEKIPDLKLTQFFKAGRKVRFLFPSDNTENLYLQREVRENVMEYINANSLQNQKRKGHVNINVALSALFEKNNGAVSVHISDLIDVVVKHMTRKVLLENAALGIEGQWLPEGCRSVAIRIERRLGRKFVTIIDYMEDFAINVDEFAHDAPRIFAASVTTEVIPGKGKGRSVIIQGDVAKDLVKYLHEKYHLPPRYATVDSSKKFKKKRT